MNDIFIAHVEEDKDVALAIALDLEEAGYTTWTYEVDSIPGPSYLIQTGEAVAASKAVIVVISPNSLGSRQVTKEVVRAHETGKEFVPVLRNITHVEFQNRQPEWREAIGGAASINISPEEVAEITPRIADGLKALGVNPNPTTEASRISQIRKILDSMEKSKTKEAARESDVVIEESERKADKREEITEITEEAEKPTQIPKKLSKSGWFWAGVVLSTIAFLILMVVSSGPQNGPEGGDSAGPIPALIVSFPLMILGSFFIKRGFNQGLHNKKSWFRSAYILLPTGLLMFFLAISSISDSSPESTRGGLVFVSVLTALPLFFIGGYCFRRGRKLRDSG